MSFTLRDMGQRVLGRDPNVPPADLAEDMSRVLGIPLEEARHYLNHPHSAMRAGSDLVTVSVGGSGAVSAASSDLRDTQRDLMAAREERRQSILRKASARKRAIMRLKSVSPAFQEAMMDGIDHETNITLRTLDKLGT